LDEAVIGVEEALIIQEEGGYIMPDRTHISYKGNTWLLMPAISEKYTSTKLISVYPGNKANGLPIIQGTVVLSDSNNGAPLAVFDAASLTALRTGAMGGVGVKWLTSETLHTAGVIGAGIQGMALALSACSQRKITRLFVFDKDTDRMHALKNKVAGSFPEVDVTFAENADHLVRDSELVITATGSINPVFSNHRELVQNKTFIGIGSYKPAMREFPYCIFEKGSRVYIDTPLAMKESGDLVQPMEAGYLEKERVTTLGKLISGEVPPNKDTIRIFKSVGMALVDLLIAGRIYDKALEQGFD